MDDIDAPENGQDFGEKSRLFLAELIAGKDIIVKSSGKDRYGRVLGTIYLDGINVNEALVRNGLAWHYKHFSKDARMDSLEKVARAEKLNIWSQPNPMDPYQFRQNKKNKNHSTISSKNEKVTSTICGVITKSGKPCQRKVSGGATCWQHK